MNFFTRAHTKGVKGRERERDVQPHQQKWQDIFGLRAAKERDEPVEIALTA
jgi:hypothetical protein